MPKRILPAFIITSLALILISSASFAENKPDPSLISGNFDGLNRTSRLTIAKYLSDHLSDIDAYIPNPSPSQVEWIKKEEDGISKIKDKDTQISRWINLHETIPYQKLAIKNTLKKCLSLIKIIRGTKDTKKEIYYWAALSSILIEKDTFHDAILVIGREVNFPTWISPITSLLIESQGKGVLNYIVIPYLHQQVK